MIKDIMTTNETVAINEKQMQVLREHFPACFHDGEFDLERFKEYLGDSLTVNNEGYELRFLGKNYARLLASIDTTTVVVPDEEHNAKPENANSQNVYISGDNLDGLKHLLKSYSKQVKCVYIDPPYNTGSDGFAYNDTFNFTIDDLVSKLSVSEEQATRILNLTKKGSASHSAWLMFMYPRLLLARDLLDTDGVIFISIDDNEQSNLKLICDDVFGEENFVANIIVQSNKRGQTYKQLAKTHEYLFVYTRNVNAELNELLKSNGSFDYVDTIGEFDIRELRNRNPKFGKFNRPNLFYPIYADPSKIDSCGFCPVSLTKTGGFTVEILPLNSEGEESCWRWGQNKFNANNNSSDSMTSEVVAKLKTTGEYGCYEKYRKGTFKAKTIWFNDGIIGDLSDEDDDIWEETGVITEQGSKELGVYGMGDAFDFPKPTYLIEKALRIGSDKNSLIVDFFSGSATTVEAVASLNNYDNGTRRVIAIQLPEDLDAQYASASDSEKAKVKKRIDFLDSVGRPHTLDQIGIERIIRAAEKIKEEHPGTTADLGFRHYTLVEPSTDTLDKLEKFDVNENGMFASDMLNEFGLSTVLSTWLVRDGYGLTATPEKLVFSDYEAYYIGKHLYLITQDLNKEAIDAILVKYETDGTFNPENIVLFGYSFTWTEMETLKTNLKRLKDIKNLHVNFDVRY